MKRAMRILIPAGFVALLLVSFMLVYARPSPLVFPRPGATIHPGGWFAIRFPERVSGRITVSLLDLFGRSVHFDTRNAPDDRVLLVEPRAPLEWQTQYDLCFTIDRNWIFRALAGPHRSCSTFSTMPKRSSEGPGDASILVAEGRDRPNSRYYAAILQAEGLNAFANLALEDLTEADLAGRAVVILDSARLPPSLDTTLLRWVTAGGLLIVMRPGTELRQFLRLPGVVDNALESALLLPDDTDPISVGLSRAAFQIHGPVDQIDEPVGQILAGPGVSDAPRVLATLASAAGEPIGGKTVTWAKVGQGHVASFAFDLARSIILTRQGSPLWIDEERDGSEPLRPNDLFYPDFIALEHAAIPAADELQRLLANLIVSLAPLPLPRFWYLPDRRRAAVIMAGDDHATDGGAPRLFSWLDLLSAPDCDLGGWECRRATAYLSPDTDLAADAATTYAKLGFEIGVHIDTGCTVPITRHSLGRLLRSQIEEFQKRYPHLPKQQTHRMHCLSWTGWVEVPSVQLEMGMRFDLNYYLWPPEWLGGRQVFLTGSGFPMPFADLNGNQLDAYQAASHLVNESGVPHETAIRQMLDGALGPNQYFGAFGTHYDFTDDFEQLLIRFSIKNNVPLITAQQMLTWLDGRNASSFSDLIWNEGLLTFKVSIAPGAERASLLLPMSFGRKKLVDVTCGKRTFPLNPEEIKGLMMTFFQSHGGECGARYKG